MPRSRSRSPRPSANRSSGFRWKDKPRRSATEENTDHRSGRDDYQARTAEGEERRGGGGYERGYRNREDERRGGYDDDRRGGNRDMGSEQDRRRHEERRGDKDNGDGGERRQERKRDRAERQPRVEREADPNPDPEPETKAASPPAVSTITSSKLDDDIAAKFGPTTNYKPSALKAPNNSTSTSTSTPSTNPSTTHAPASAPSTAPPPRAPTGPMTIIKVNDRLGTTTRVPCLGSDTIGDFKKLVAMRIGRRPHEIMLKRQSERPFKDFLTLEDYGVGDGVQLDLEIDTGD